ncbi:MAG: DUF1934 family protein [Clostridia bacterium]|nr:DUF1934 family protein [Clostridia bacterium]
MQLLDLKVTTRHWSPSDPLQKDETTCRTKGILRQKDDHDTLRYQLVLGDKGDNGNFRCEWILPHSDTGVTMKQTGDSDVCISFVRGSASETIYRIQNGEIAFRTETLDLVKTRDSLYVRYDLIAPNGERTCHEILWNRASQ